MYCKPSAVAKQVLVTAEEAFSLLFLRIIIVTAAMIATAIGSPITSGVINGSPDWLQ